MSVQPERPGTRHDGERPAQRDAGRFLVDAITSLHANGAESDRAERRTGQLARVLDLDAQAELGWSWSDFSIRYADGDCEIRRSTARPDALLLNRVLAVDEIIDDLDAGTLSLTDATQRLRTATALPATDLTLFTIACIVGGCGLAVLFGVRHVGTVGLIAACCAVGAWVRRGLGGLGANGYTQVSAAAVLAGLCGAASSGLGIGSPLGLAALCPCMILVPGPHILKGSLEIATLRIPLGASRLVFAAATMTAITAGLLLGLWMGGAHLVADPAGRHVSIWIDVPTAGVLAVAYGVFYAAPLRILYWPFFVGGAAHALRWLAIEKWGADPWVGAGLACLLVGLVLLPVCERWQLPFAALGFASVVSLVPGVLLFRALAGFAQLPSTTGAASQRLLVEIADNASSAALIMLAMPIGFLVANAVWSRLPIARPPAAAAAPVRRPSSS